MMTTMLFAFASSFVLAIAIVPLARWICARFGLVDKPDGRRKIHKRPTPLAGGLAIFVSLIGAWLVLSQLDTGWEQYASIDIQLLLGLLGSLVILVSVGVADDYGLLRGRHKLLGQIFAVGLLVLSGLVVRRLHIFGLEIELGFFSYPFTAFWLLGAINSLNLLDGMDGLLGTIALVAASAVGAIALAAGDLLTAFLAASVAGAILGFLVYNLPPASVFLGDAGSMSLGLIVGVLALRSATTSNSGLVLLPALALLALPILDTSTAIVRRKLTGRSVYTTDRGHLHHVLLRHGFSPGRVLQLVALMSTICSLGAAAGILARVELVAAVTAVLVVVILVTTRLYGHAEYQLLRNRLVAAGRSFFHGPQSERADQLEVHLQGSADWRQLWRQMTEHALRLNLQSVRLDVNAPALHEGYHARWDRPHVETECQDYWYTLIPLTAGGQNVGRLEIRGLRDEVPVCDRILQVARLVEEFEKAASLMSTARHDTFAGSLGVMRSPALLSAAD